MIIEGTILTLDEKNANGDIIPHSEAQNVINSVKNSKVRICNRNEPHGCDASPFSEIGNVLSAFQVGNEIKARAKITDTIAHRKLTDGTWEKQWSIGAKAKNDNGYRTDVSIHSLTLVKNAAYKDAIFEIMQADTKDLYTSHNNIILIGDQNMSEPQITELNQTIEQLRADNTKLAASLKDFEDVKMQLLNANDKLAASIPSSQIKELVQAGITAYKEHEQKTTLIEKLEAATGKKGEYNSLSASALTDILNAIEKNPITVNSNTSSFPNGVPEYRNPRGNK